MDVLPQDPVTLAMVRLAAFVTLVTLAGWLASRRAGRPTAHAALVAVTWAVLLTPGLSWLATRLAIGWVEPHAATAARDATGPATVVALVDRRPAAARPASPATATPVAVARPVTASGAGVGAAAWLAGLWAAGAVVQLAWLLRGLLRVRRLARSARPLDPAVAARARTLARGLGLRRPLRVQQSSRVAAPLAMGWSRPRILLPPGLAARLAPEELEAILLHEVGHLVHRHHWLGLLQRVVLALWWWHPGVRWTHQRLGALSEELCDNYVMRSPLGGRRYARCLVELAATIVSTRSPVLPATAGLLTSRRQFSARIKGLLDEDRDTMTTMNHRQRFGLGLFAALLLAGLWALPLRADDPPPAPRPRPKAEAPKGKAPKAAAPRLTLRARLARRVTLDFDAAPLADVLQFFARLSGVDILLDPRKLPDRKVTLTVRDVRLDQALGLVGRLTGTEWRVTCGVVVVGVPGTLAGYPARPAGLPAGLPASARKAIGNTLTVDFAGTPLSDVLAFLRQIGQLNLVQLPGLADQTTLTLALRNVSLHDLLTLLAARLDGELAYGDGAWLLRPRPAPRCAGCKAELQASHTFCPGCGRRSAAPPAVAGGGAR